jgi:phosphodiesterase/alkaline phosphatase D-like protein
MKRWPLLDRRLGWLSGRAPALFDALHNSRASNPLILGGDVHSFFAAELNRLPTQPLAGNPVIATEFCGTSVTSPSRPQARTEQYVSMNHGIAMAAATSAATCC